MSTAGLTRLSLPDALGDDVGGALAGFLDPVAVDVRRGRRVTVADPAAYAAHREAGIEELGHLRMAQAVQLHPVGQLETLAQQPEPLREP